MVGLQTWSKKICLPKGREFVYLNEATLSVTMKHNEIQLYKLITSYT